MGKVQDVAERYWQAEESRNLSAILEFYHSDGELVVPDMGRLIGHSEISRFYSASIARFKSLTVEILQGVEMGQRGAFEWRATFMDEYRAITISQGANLVSIKDGKFQFVHVYYGS